MLVSGLRHRFQVYIPLIATTGSMAIRALFPILGAYFFSQEDYVTAVAFVGILSIVGMIAGLEFHSVIIRELSKNIVSARYRQRAVFKNLATAIPRVLISSVFIWSLIWPIIGGKLAQPATLILLPLIVFLDLILCEASRIHNTTGEFVVGTILTNAKNVGWLFILPFILLTGLSVVDSLILSYGFSLIVLILLFGNDFRIRDLIALPKCSSKNIQRFFLTLRGSIFLLLVGWIGLLNPMVERYMLALSENIEFTANFFFMGSLAAIAYVLTTNITLIPFHSTLLRPKNLDNIVVVQLMKRILVTCLLVVAGLISMFWLIPQEYFPENILKKWDIFLPLVIASQIMVIGSFFSIRLYAAKADVKLLAVSIAEFLMRVGLVFLLIRMNTFHHIPIGMMWLTAMMCLIRFFIYRAVNIK